MELPWFDGAGMFGIQRIAPQPALEDADAPAPDPEQPAPPPVGSEPTAPRPTPTVPRTPRSGQDKVLRILKGGRVGPERASGSLAALGEDID